MNSNFEVIDLIRLGIKPKFTATEANALTTRPSEAVKSKKSKDEAIFDTHSNK